MSLTRYAAHQVTQFDEVDVFLFKTILPLEETFNLKLLEGELERGIYLQILISFKEQKRGLWVQLTTA